MEPIYSEEMLMDCLLCGSDQKKTFARVESYGFPLVYYQCETCGLIFQSLEESQAADPEFYRKTYRRIYQASEAPTPKDLWVQEQRAAHFVEIIKSQEMNKLHRILDFGASAGVLLNKFQAAFGSEVMGVEPDDLYRAFAMQSGIKMVPSLDALLDSRQEKFDLVSLSHVLEHLKNPVGVLTTIRTNLLKDGGALLVEVPNFYAHDSYELAHLACYTPHSLREVLKQAGFKLVLLKKHGVPRSRLLNLYLTGIAKASPKAAGIPPIKEDQFVGLKRKISMLYRRLIQKVFPHKAWLPVPVIDQV